MVALAKSASDEMWPDITFGPVNLWNLPRQFIGDEMNIERVKEQEKFKPVVLKVEINSQEELTALQCLSHMDETVPEMVANEYHTKNIEQSLFTFLTSLRVALQYD